MQTPNRIYGSIANNSATNGITLIVTIAQQVRYLSWVSRAKDPLPGVLLAAAAYTPNTNANANTNTNTDTDANTNTNPTNPSPNSNPTNTDPTNTNTSTTTHQAPENEDPRSVLPESRPSPPSPSLKQSALHLRSPLATGAAGVEGQEVADEVGSGREDVLRMLRRPSNDLSLEEMEW